MSDSNVRSVPGQRGAVLSLDFYRREVREVARDLLGMHLVTLLRGKRTAGLIVETEAYLPQGDSACHGSKKRTPRTEVMFAAGGVAYVYPIHARVCFNVVTGETDQPAAVLIRAIEPTEGIEWMQRRRQREKLTELARGPGRLCQALGIDRAINGWDLSRGERIWIESHSPVTAKEIIITPRIGVTSATDLLLRYAIGQNCYVSRPRLADC